jgi:HAD superfamily hydrolase (TIGR01509 family)
VSSPRWSPFIKQLVLIAILAVGVWLLVQARTVLPALILALLLGYIVAQPVPRFVRGTGWPRGVAVAISELLVLLVIMIFGAVILPWLVSALSTFVATLVNLVQELLGVTPKPVTLVPGVTIDLGPFYRPLNQWLSGVVATDLSEAQTLQAFLGTFANSAAVVLRRAASGITYVFVIVVLAFYVARDSPRLWRYAAARLPDPLRHEVAQLLRDLGRIWNAFLRGQFVLALIVGIMVWLAMAILGVRSAVVLGLISGLMEFVPAIGPVIAAVPGVAIAFFLGSSWLPIPNLWLAAIVLLVYVVIQQFESLYLIPKVIGGRIRLHPAVVIVGVLVGARLGGILGILLAAPTIASAKVLLRYAYRKLLDMDAYPATAAEATRAALWRDRLESQPPRAILFDLDGTLIETDDRAVANLADRLAFTGRLMTSQQRATTARRVVMSSEGVLNGLLAFLDVLHLDQVFAGIRQGIRRLQGAAQPATLVPVAGSLDMLYALRQKGYALGLVTSRGRPPTEAYLDAFGLHQVFDAVITADDVRRLKPHPQPVERAAAALHLKARECVMVGDTSVDSIAARAAGALSVGVLTGFGLANDFRDADLLLPSAAELVEWL